MVFFCGKSMVLISVREDGPEFYPSINSCTRRVKYTAAGPIGSARDAKFEVDKLTVTFDVNLQSQPICLHS